MLGLAKDVLEEYPTPFYIYDAEGIRGSARALNQVFAWNDGFRNYFAVKATPNPAILQLLLDEGMGLDCSSSTELLMAQRLKVPGERIMFTSNDTALSEYELAGELGAIVNIDDPNHINILAEAGHLPESICVRYNPGEAVSGNSLIGRPLESKFGMTRHQVLESAHASVKGGSRLTGLHTMVVSNNLDLNTSLQIVEAVFSLARELYEQRGVELEFINLGGGIGIPYKPNDMPFPIEEFSNSVRGLYEGMLPYAPRLAMECGRYVTGPHGYLVSKVLHIKKTYKTYAGLDAAMHNLMRPAMYGAYHHISVVGKENEKANIMYDITGSLCENNDKFAVDRVLPYLETGDTIIIHDVGAHGHAMGFNYNGKLRSAEVLLETNGSSRLIRRAETPDDYFATLV